MIATGWLQEKRPQHVPPCWGRQFIGRTGQSRPAVHQQAGWTAMVPVQPGEIGRQLRSWNFHDWAILTTAAEPKSAWSWADRAITADSVSRSQCQTTHHASNSTKRRSTSPTSARPV